MSTLNRIMGKLAKDEDGAALVEYGLLVALIAAVCLAAIKLLGGNINTIFQNIANAIIPPA